MVLTESASVEAMVSQFTYSMLGKVKNPGDNAASTAAESGVSGEEWHFVFMIPSELEEHTISYFGSQSGGVVDSKLDTVVEGTHENIFTFADSRQILFSVKDTQQQSEAGQALSMCSWHEKNQFDGQSGEPTQTIECGMKRAVAESGRKQYPRIDPVVIACVLSPDKSKCLLGKMKRSPPFFYSCLSGFVEVPRSL
jgi:NAD+ diphosphatase